MTPHRAAKVLGVHIRTIYRWIDKAENMEPSPLKLVKRQNNGRLVLSVEDIGSIKDCRKFYRFKRNSDF